MALLKFKRSATPSKVPTTSDLDLGELALNTYDGKVYMKKDDGTQAIVEVGGSGGGGTVTSVAASGGTTGFSFTGSPITTSGTLTLTGTLNVANGGTGATTAAGALANLGAQAAATALTTSTTFGGDVSGTYNAIVVADDSHNHIYDNIDGLTTNGWGGPRITTASGYIDFGPANTAYAHIYTDRPTFYFNVDTSANNAYGRTSVRAPIFYDSANTSYYLDPASTGNSLIVAGNVGIGTTSPDQLLHLSANNSATLRFESTKTVVAADDVMGAIEWEGNDSTTGSSGVVGKIDYIAEDTTPEYAMRFFTHDNVGGVADFAERMRITSSGNVGIGDTSPQTKLDVKTYYSFGNAANGAIRAEDWSDASRGGYFEAISGLRIFDASSYYGAEARLPEKTTSSGMKLDLGTIKFFTDASLTVGTNYTPTERMVITDSGNVGIATTSPSQKLQVQGTGYATSDFRAPIFYDSANTAYYLDPASTGTSLNVAGSVKTPSISRLDNGNVAITLSDATYTRINDPSGSIKVWIGNNDTTYYNNNTHYFRNSASTLSFSIDTSGNAIATGSHRAPIFYDSNNTAYYVDPASSTSASFASTVQFANTTQSKLNLYGTSYQIGIQSNTQYYRSTNRFSWFRGGVHSNTENDPGTGGTVAMTLDSSSNLTVTGNVTAYSDIRVKDNVKQIEGALEKVQAIRGVTYNRTDLEDTERRYGGVIAQEIEEVLPEAIFENDDRKAVDYNATIGLLIEAIKELKAEVDTLRAEAVTIRKD